MVDKLYHRANPRSSFRPTVRFVVERYSTSFAIVPHGPNNREITVQRRCYARIWRFRILHVTRKSIKWTRAEPFEMNIKIKQELNFVVDNDSRLFLDAQEAKKVSNVQ